MLVSCGTHTHTLLFSMCLCRLASKQRACSVHCTQRVYYSMIFAFFHCAEKSTDNNNRNWYQKRLVWRLGSGWQQNEWDNDKSICTERIPKITIGQGNSEICTATHTDRQTFKYVSRNANDDKRPRSCSLLRVLSLSISPPFISLMKFPIDFMNVKNPRRQNANGLVLNRQGLIYLHQCYRQSPHQQFNRFVNSR